MYSITYHLSFYDNTVKVKVLGAQSGLTPCDPIY